MALKTMMSIVNDRDNPSFSMTIFLLLSRLQIKERRGRGEQVSNNKSTQYLSASWLPSISSTSVCVIYKEQAICICSQTGLLEVCACMFGSVCLESVVCTCVYVCVCVTTEENLLLLDQSYHMAWEVVVILNL